VLLRQLLARGATVAAFDPVAMMEARRVLQLDLDAEQFARLRFAATPMVALLVADALVIVTEWKTFRSTDFELVKSRLKRPLVFDGRNLFEPEQMAEIGIEYHGIGRSVLTRR
jgi:UDPglucose 6-dehydrogenase